MAENGFFARIKNGLDKTRRNIMGNVESVLAVFTKIDEELFEELEEALIAADIGVPTTEKIISELRDKVKLKRITEVSEIKNTLYTVIADILTANASDFIITPPAVLLIIGVNGVGKTTSVGKLINHYKNNGHSVLVAAADTFRAAAVEQLGIWVERAGAQMISHITSADPAAVVYDAVSAAKARNTDILICDTAGRLHNKKNLMEELKKIRRIIEREYTGAQIETLLVLDASTGQNALQQARLFNEAADITGLILTKLDSTAKGGIVIAIKDELDIPVRFIGIGEGLDDLRGFSASDFARALFDTEDES